MGRYYTGDIDGKFMFAVQNSDAGERFGAVSQHSNYIDYVVYKEDSYEDICNELNAIEQTGCIKRVTKMFDNEVGYNDDICQKYGVSQKDLMEFADYRMGKQIKEWFDNNPMENELNFEAEL